MDYADFNTTAYVSGEADWDDGQFSFKGWFEAELVRSDNGWQRLSFYWDGLTELRYYAEADADQLRTAVIELARNSSENKGREFIELTEFGQISYTRSDTTSFSVSARFTSKDEDMTYDNAIELSFLVKPGEKTDYSKPETQLEYVVASSLINEIDRDITQKFLITDSTTVPKYMVMDYQGFGSATLHLHVGKDMAVTLTGNLGGLPVLLSGRLESDKSITVFNTTQVINVDYRFLIKMNGDLTFTVSSTKLILGEVISGTLNYKSAAIGVSGFDIILIN